MTKKVARRNRERNPEYVKGVLKDVNTEIAIWQERLDKGLVPEREINSVEARVCCLMNQTLPNKEALLEKALKRERGVTEKISK